MPHFKIIQGGMGAAVSSWKLASAVAKLGQLGVVSGTGLPVLLARQLQAGDLDGSYRRALTRFPFPHVAKRILDRYFIEGGKPANAPFILTPMPLFDESQHAIELTVAGNFAEVFLAKENHAGVIGINYLEKIQLQHLPAIFGAMLAHIDYILMGAGIPRFIPGVLDNFAKGLPASYPIDVDQPEGQPRKEFLSHFSPAHFIASAQTPGPESRTPNPEPLAAQLPSIFPLPRPNFYGIISSATLAMTLARKSNGAVQGFIIEGKTAGGHNAPPRGPLQLNERGEPVYGPRDIPDLDKIKELNLPFFLAGGYGRPGKLAEALEMGAAGIQVGTAFAFCDESGLDPEIKRIALAKARAGTADIFTDPLASPTGFPIKIMRLDGSLSDAPCYDERPRICDVGFLRRPFLNKDGNIAYRCPAEPVDQYVKKGGNEADTAGRKCLCNALMANVSFPQIRPDSLELPLVTAGDDAAIIHQLLPDNRPNYSAADVIRLLLAPTPEPVPAIV